MNKDILFKVDPNITFSINTQIKEQLRWLIGIGQIVPGEMLPAANQLADMLSINRNTVNLVYNQLRDEGILSMHKGRGTQVISGPKVDELRRKRLPMYELLTKTIEGATTQGIRLDEFFISGLAYTLLHEQETSQHLHIVFVECQDHDHFFYRNEIERITGAKAKTVFIDNLTNHEDAMIEALEYSNIIVTTLNHSEEVQKLFSSYDKRVLSIGATTEMSLLLEISKLQPKSEVSFVCLGKMGGQWMANRVQDAGISQINTSAIGVDNKRELMNCITKSDKVYASGAVYEEVKSLSPDKVELYPMVLERSSQNLLKELINS